MLKSLGEVSDLVYVDILDLLCSIAVGIRLSGFQNGGLKPIVLCCTKIVHADPDSHTCYTRSMNA